MGGWCARRSIWAAPSACTTSAFLSRTPPPSMKQSRVFLDLETSGLSVLNDCIVEIGCLAMSGEAFSTVVHQMAPGEGAVHGIDAEEIAQGPPFRKAFLRLARFVENLCEMAVAERSDSSQECGATSLQPMEMVVCAHNGVRWLHFLVWGGS